MSEYEEIPSSGDAAVDAAEEAGEPKLTPMPAYDPSSWRETLFVLEGRPFVTPGTRTPLYTIWAIGAGIVALSAIVGVTLEENDRKCRAWCSQFSLGPQPHSYFGVILFLLFAFRSNHAYSSYEAGLSAWTAIRREILTFASVLLNMAPKGSIKAEERLRMLAFATAFPYALHADLCETREFPADTVERIMRPADFARLRKASSMPLFCIESLMRMVQRYATDAVPADAKRMMNLSIHNLMAPFADADRIKNNPVAFAYITHLRLLLVIYLTALPLALVESLGWSTIPVFFAISYSLMSLEMIAVEIENPFGAHASDLRILDMNEEMEDLVGEMSRRFLLDREPTSAAEYAGGFGVRNSLNAAAGRYKFW